LGPDNRRRGRVDPEPLKASFEVNFCYFQLYESF